MNTRKKASTRSRQRSGSSRKKEIRKAHAGTGARLTIINGCFSGLEITIQKDSTTLGRDVDCDICLDHSLVSPQHATITRSGDFYLIEDLNSRHGTSIDGSEVHKIRLKRGNIIGIGNFQLRFHA